MTLRPYQQSALDAIAREMAHDRRRVVMQMATGLGKTVTFAAMLQDPALIAWLGQFPERERKMLIIAHREELLEQAREKIARANPGVMVSIEQGPRYANRYSDVVIASIQTLAAQKFKRLQALLERHVFRLVVVDECFPAGTLVSGRPIETLTAGDAVLAFDTRTHLLAQKRVVRRLEKITSAICEVSTSKGPLVCTPEHKVWTEDGWKRASSLVAGDTIAHHVDASCRNLSPLPYAVSVDGEISHRHLAPVRADVLHTRASGPVVVGAEFATDGGDQSPIRVGAHDGQESDADESEPREDAAISTGAGPSSESARRQWSPGAASSEGTGRGLGVADRGDIADGAGIQAPSLQAGHCESGTADRNRSGWREPSHAGAAATGSAQGRLSSWARVDRVAVYQRGRDERFECLCPGGRVYDLEVEDFHTYFADGFAVSNCHHAAAPSYRTALVHLGFLPMVEASTEENDETATESDAAALAQYLAEWDQVAPRDRLLVGATATPNRTDAIGLGCVFQSIAFTYPIRKAVEDGWLAPIVPWVVDTSVSLDGVRTQRGDFNQRELADAVNNPHRNGLAVDAWHKYAHERQTLAFTVDVQHAHDLAAAFRARGVRAAAVSGETPKEERRALLADFRRGALDVLTNCMVLTEGTDLPMTSCILHAKPTKSATLYEQMTGRGLRLHPGKSDCIVIDVVDVARKHSLQTVPVLYGLPPGLVSQDGKSLSQIAEAFEAFVAAHPGVNVEKLGRVAIEQLQVRAQTFNIWEIPSLGAFGAGRAMNWVKTAADTFRLQYPWQDGTEVLVVAPDLLGQYAVSCTFRGSGLVRQRTLVSGVATAVEAADFAERYILAERREVRRLTDKDAGWRKQAATDRQKAALRWRRIPFRETITKGEAADLLNFARAKAGQ